MCKGLPDRLTGAELQPRVQPARAPLREGTNHLTLLASDLPVPLILARPPELSEPSWKLEEK